MKVSGVILKEIYKRDSYTKFLKLKKLRRNKEKLNQEIIKKKENLKFSRFPPTPKIRLLEQVTYNVAKITNMIKGAVSS